MQRLSISLRRRLSHHIFGECFEGAPFLVWMHDFPDAIEELCTYARVEFQEQGSPIFSVGVHSDVIYFLVDGKVEIYDVTPKSKSKDLEAVEDDFLHDVMSPGGHPLTPKSIARVMGSLSIDKMATRTSRFTTFDLAKFSRSGTGAGDDGQDNFLQPSTHNKIQKMSEVWEQIWESAKDAVSHQDYLVELPEIREVEAPAFMGEAVLWNKESEAIRQYTAKCKERCELVLSSKAHIDAVVMKNPLLYERYQAFCWYTRLYTYEHGLPVNCADFIRKVSRARTNAAPRTPRSKDSGKDERKP
jgi:CRP-like cAMP-binding protein